MIIGAAKSATSWLTRCLIEHPQAVIPPGEVHYFSWHYEGGAALPPSYLGLFASATEGQVCGENSNTYLSHPRGAERIHASLPGVRLIVSLRNPVDRAYSDWAMRLRQRYRLSDLDRFLDPDRAPDLWFLHKGLYFPQVQAFLRYYPRDRMHFLLMDDMRDDPVAAFAAVCRFLGIDDGVVPPSLRARVNAGDVRPVFPALRERLMRHGAGRRVVEKLRGSPLFPLIRTAFGREIKAPPLPEPIRAKLCEFYRADVEAMSGFLGRDLSHWVRC